MPRWRIRLRCQRRTNPISNGLIQLALTDFTQIVDVKNFEPFTTQLILDMHHPFFGFLHKY